MSRLDDYLAEGLPFRRAMFERLVSDLNGKDWLARRNAGRKPGSPTVRGVRVADEYREDGQCVRGLCGAVQVNGWLLLCLRCALEAV